MEAMVNLSSRIGAVISHLDRGGTDLPQTFDADNNFLFELERRALRLEQTLNMYNVQMPDLSGAGVAPPQPALALPVATLPHKEVYGEDCFLFPVESVQTSWHADHR